MFRGVTGVPGADDSGEALGLCFRQQVLGCGFVRHEHAYDLAPQGRANGGNLFLTPRGKDNAWDIAQFIHGKGHHAPIERVIDNIAMRVNLLCTQVADRTRCVE